MKTLLAQGQKGEYGEKSFFVFCLEPAFHASNFHDFSYIEPAIPLSFANAMRAASRLVELKTGDILKLPAELHRCYLIEEKVWQATLSRAFLAKVASWGFCLLGEA